MYIHLYIEVSLIEIHECSRTAIQNTLKPWCLGSYADLAYSSYSDAQASILYTHSTPMESLQNALRLSWRLYLVACMPTRLVSCIMSLALTLMQ